MVGRRRRLSGVLIRDAVKLVSFILLRPHPISGVKLSQSSATFACSAVVNYRVMTDILVFLGV